MQLSWHGAGGAHTEKAKTHVHLAIRRRGEHGSPPKRFAGTVRFRQRAVGVIILSTIPEALGEKLSSRAG